MAENKKAKKRKIRKEKVSTMKKKLRKAIAVLVIAANTIGLCAPAYAEEAPTRTEEAYTVTEDEQGTVTILFDEPIVLTRVEDDVVNETEGEDEDDGIVPYGDTCFTSFPQIYWGTYISTLETYTLVIEDGTHVLFDGYFNNNKIYCHDNLTAIHFYPERSMTGGLLLHYSNYTRKTDTGNSFVNQEIDIGGYYNKSNKTFVIAGIVYRP